MSEKQSSTCYLDVVLPRMELDAVMYEVLPADTLCFFHEGERVDDYCKNRRPEARVSWLKRKGTEYEVSSVTLSLLDNAQELIVNGNIEDNERFEELLAQTTKQIQKQINMSVMPKIQHGQKFQGNVRGPRKTTELLDQELQRILSELGADATFTDVLKTIEREADNMSPFFQDVDWDQGMIAIKDPARRDHEETRSFKTIQNRVPQIKTIIASSRTK